MPVDIDGAGRGFFDLKARAASLRQGSEYANNGRSAQTLAKGPDFNVTLVVIGDGIELAEHSAPGSAMITVTEGEVAFVSGDEEQVVTAGDTVVFAAGLTHSVRGIDESAFQLVIAKP